MEELKYGSGYTKKEKISSEEETRQPSILSDSSVVRRSEFETGSEQKKLCSASEIDVIRDIHKSTLSTCQLGRFRGSFVVIKRAIVSGYESIERIRNEAAIISDPRLCESVVAPIAVIEAPPHYSMLLPLMENGSLDDIIKTKVLPFPLILCLLLDIARAVDKIHDVGIIHRDIKPANFLVDSSWRAWVTDFGSAQIVERSVNQDKPGMPKTGCIGQPSGGYHKKVLDGTTLRYLAPEVLSGYDSLQSSDVYSMGMSFCEIVTGVPPFQEIKKDVADMYTVMDASYSHHDLITAIVSDDLRPTLQLDIDNGFASSTIRSLIEKMWSGKTEMRPTAKEVVTALEAIIIELSIETGHQYRSRIYPVTERNNEKQVYEKTFESTERADEAVNHGRDFRPFNRKLLSDQRVSFGTFASSGMRGDDKMEDRHCLIQVAYQSGTLLVATVLDGHGGSGCSSFVNSRLCEWLVEAAEKDNELFIKEENRKTAISRIFTDIDKLHRDSCPSDTSGSTGLAAMLYCHDARKGSAGFHLVVANAGDSRAVLCRRNKARQDEAIRLSRDHTPENKFESERIRACGGEIVFTPDKKLRVGGYSQVTRSFGDHAWKGCGITAEPEILEYDLEADAGHEFIILATDGIWDVLSDIEAVQIVRNTAKDAGLAAKRLCMEAISSGSNDNMTCIVIFLKRFNQQKDIKYA